MNSEKTGFWADFISFALRGNVVDLAMAVVVGGAFAKITNSIVNDLLMPLLNPLIPGGDWRTLQIGSGLRIGQFAGTVLDDVIEIKDDVNIIGYARETGGIMTSGTNRSYYDYLGVGSLLACVAGVVNAVGFSGFGGFVTHVSGNATRAAVEYSEGHFLVAGVFFVGIVFFISGAFTTTLLLRGHSIESQKVTYAFPVLLEALLIGCVAWFGSRHVSPGQTLEITRLKDAWFLNLLTFAMGMQNAIIRQGSGTIIRTTHMTGIVTDLGIAMGTVVSRSSAEFFKNPKHFLQRQQNQDWSSLLKGRIHTIYQRFHLERFFLHTSLLLSFLLGAVLGTFGYLRVGLKVLTAPLIALVLLAALELVNWRKRTSQHEHELQNAR